MPVTGCRACTVGREPHKEPRGAPCPLNPGSAPARADPGHGVSPHTDSPSLRSQSCGLSRVPLGWDTHPHRPGRRPGATRPRAPFTRAHRAHHTQETGLRVGAQAPPHPRASPHGRRRPPCLERVRGPSVDSPGSAPVSRPHPGGSESLPLLFYWSRRAGTRLTSREARRAVCCLQTAPGTSGPR